VKFTEPFSQEQPLTLYGSAIHPKYAGFYQHLASEADIPYRPLQIRLLE
jgi:hypothetical protein